MVTEGRGPDTFWGCQGPGLLLAFCGVRAPACCHHPTSREIFHHFRQVAPSDVLEKTCARKFYIKIPAFSYPFGPEKSSPRNFYIKSRPF